jgi:hypothetical protein
MGADGPKRWTGSTPTAEDIDNPLEPLYDAYFKMYSNVTYKSVAITVEPFIFDFVIGPSSSPVNKVACHSPMATTLDVNTDLIITDMTSVLDYT